MEKMPESIHDQVRKQYEYYPYPAIDPQRDKPGMLVTGHLSLMCEILWAGKKSPQQLRVLDAGCGTGSPLAAMAIAYPDTEIMGIDFSDSSLNIAQKLVDKYELNNVRLKNISIEQVEELGLQFDYIISSGVLHHLEAPAMGLKALGKVLSPQGVISMMLYGKYGRTGIYMLQEVIKMMCPGESIDRRLPVVRRLLAEIPPHHPFKSRKAGREISEGKDAGIVDLLLHANDIPFDVDAIYSLCEQAGMQHYRWLFPVIYNPLTYIKDSLPAGYFTTMDPKTRAKTAELLHGAISKHSFFAVKPGFNSTNLAISRGGWRGLKATLTPCMKWDQIGNVPGKDGVFFIPPAVVQDEWAPLELQQWELAFLSMIQREIPLGQVIEEPSVKRVLPFDSKGEIDIAVEKLLDKTIEIMALVLLV